MYKTFLVTQTVKNLPAMHKTRVQFLGQKDPLEKRMATLLPGESHGQRSPAGYNQQGRKELAMTK